MAPKKHRLMNYKAASDLLDDPYSCLEKIQSQRKYSLPLSCLNKVQKDIHRLLEEETGKYSDELSGIIISFENVKILKSNSNFSDDIPYTVIDAAIDFIVFKPNVGSTLRGTVTKTSSFYASCVVHGCFNASLRKSKDYGLQEQVKNGYKVALEVVSLNYINRIIQIEGKLLEILEETPVEDEQDQINGSETSQVNIRRFWSEDSSVTTETVGQKRLRNGDIDESSVISESNTEAEPQETPKKKRRKLNEDENESLPESSTTQDTEMKSPSKKHKKKKRNKDLSENGLAELLEPSVLSELESYTSQEVTVPIKKEKKKKRSSIDEKSLAEIESSLLAELEIHEMQSPTKTDKKRKSETSITEMKNSIMYGCDIKSERQSKSPSKSVKNYGLQAMESEIKLKSHLISESEDDMETSQSTESKPKKKKKGKHHKDKDRSKSKKSKSSSKSEKHHKSKRHSKSDKSVKKHKIKVKKEIVS
ncbi:hypothetical protein CHUAL_005704 [Chamberlinius hualienensis]